MPVSRVRAYSRAFLILINEKLFAALNLVRAVCRAVLVQQFWGFFSHQPEEDSLAGVGVLVRCFFCDKKTS
jgi:hypothetical protein